MSDLDMVSVAVLQALCRSQRYVRASPSALLALTDDLPLLPHVWSSSCLQALHCWAGADAAPGSSGGGEAREDCSLLTVIYAPGQPGLEVGCWARRFVQPHRLWPTAGARWW